MSLAQKHGRSVAQIILRWLVQRELLQSQNQYTKKELLKISAYLILNFLQKIWIKLQRWIKRKCFLFTSGSEVVKVFVH